MTSKSATSAAQKREMLRWLKMWDRPERELRGNRIIDADVDVDRLVDDIFSTALKDQ